MAEDAPHNAHYGVKAAAHKTHAAATGVHLDSMRGAILRGTSQLGSRFSDLKKQQ